MLNWPLLPLLEFAVATGSGKKYKRTAACQNCVSRSNDLVIKRLLGDDLGCTSRLK